MYTDNKFLSKYLAGYNIIFEKGTYEWELYYNPTENISICWPKEGKYLPGVNIDLDKEFYEDILNMIKEYAAADNFKNDWTSY